VNDLPPDARRAAAILRRDATLDPAQRERLLALALAAAVDGTAAGARDAAPTAHAPWIWLAPFGVAALLAAGIAGMRPRPSMARVAPAVAVTSAGPAAIEHGNGEDSNGERSNGEHGSVATGSVATGSVATGSVAVVAEPRGRTRVHRPSPLIAAGTSAPPAAPAATAPLATTPPAAPAVNAPAAFTLEEELSVVRAARAANDRGAPLIALEGLQASPPLRLVWAEGAAERVVALCALGRRSDAAALGAEVLRRVPAGASAARVRRSCGGLDPR
jgi:hypothetical protein